VAAETLLSDSQARSDSGAVLKSTAPSSDGLLPLDPPVVDVLPEVDWLLLRAFGAPDTAWPADVPLDRDRLLEIGRSLWLLPRVRSRTSREVFEEHLGRAKTWLIDRMWRQSTASALRHQEVCRCIAELAQRLEIPVIFLKGMVLQLKAVIRAGSRMTADIDILVPSDRSEELRQRLLDSGSRASGLRESEQHLPVITHKLGAQMEIHHRLQGVCFDEATSATAEQCLERGLVELAPGLGGHSFVTGEELTVAHLLVHALALHRRAPAMYPGFQLLADLQDLGYSPAGGREVSPHSRAWIAGDVRPAEIDAALMLLARMERGEAASEIVAEGESVRSSRPSSGASAVLLRHLLAGALDSEYQKSLKLANQLKTASGRLRPDWPKRIWRALWLTPAQIDILYGKPRTRLGYLGWRLWRPFHLVGKSVASIRAWLGVRVWRR